MAILGKIIGGPSPASVDVQGTELILDADGDTTITADTDDQIDIKIAGADDFQFTANKLLVQTGSIVDLNGTELILDADADTSITADTDDQIDFKIAGADDFRMTANTLSVLSGTTLNIDSGATIANSGTATGFGGGKIGQVLSTTKTDRTSITSSTTNAYADISGLTQAVTCAATSSKVLISGYVSWHLDSGNGTIHYGIFRDSTQIGQGVDSGGTSRNPSTVSFRGVGASDSTLGQAWYTYGFISQAFHFLDSPSSTSEITYSIKVSGGTTYTSTVIINGTDTVTGNSGYADYQPVASSGITCMEVLA